MQIKRFESQNIQDALKQVREALGPEAIILSTKTLKKSTLPYDLRRGTTVEVIAAIDRAVEATGPLPSSPVLPSTPFPRPGVKEKEQGEKTLVQRMLSAGLSPEFVNGMVKEIQRTRRELPGWGLSETYRGLLRWKVMEEVEVTGPSFQGPKIWSFIGPTGVGKTTTLVKLAAHFHLRVTQKISLISIDTYRIGAVEQLRTYAQILGIPLEVAHHREELGQIIERHRHQDLLLIDTAGRSPNHRASFEELRDFLTVHPRIENHLVLSATTKDRDLERMATCFALLPIKSYIFSKIDETEEYIPLLNQLFRQRKPLSYLTCGQRVPEDLELATKVRVANLVLNQIQWN
jgi:flagellar biosynthesis protein FlhF